MEMKASQAEQMIELLTRIVQELSEIKAQMKLEYPNQSKRLGEIQRLVGNLAQQPKR